MIPENTRREVACYDNELLMDCPLNTYIQVYDAFYGRLSPDVCPPEDPDQVTGDYVDCPTSCKQICHGNLWERAASIIHKTN